MKAISLWQPWASAIALGHKRIETRGWSTRYRGPLAIHAAKKWTAEEREMSEMFETSYGLEGLSDPPRGCIVAIAELTSVRPTEHLTDTISEIEEMLGNYGPGRFGFMLENVRRLSDPLLYRGMQGFFEVPDEMLAGRY